MDNITIFDLETTGRKDGQNIVQFAGIKGPVDTFSDNDWLDKAEQLKLNIRPNHEITPSAMSVHHITNKQASTFRILDQSLEEEIVEFLADSTYVSGYNIIAFDVPVLKSVISYSNVFGNVRDYLDGAVLAKKMFDREVLGGLSLDAVMWYLIDNAKELADTRSSHDALVDCRITYHVLRAIIRKLPGDVERNIEGALKYQRKRVPVEKMPFGKHQDKPVAEVYMKNPGYISWLLRQPWLQEEWPDFHWTLMNLKDSR